MKVKYVGEIESVQIPSEGIVVNRGDEFEVSEQTGSSLLMNQNFIAAGQVRVRDTKPIKNIQTKGVE